MRQRGRKTAGTLTAVTAIQPERLAPPSTLTAEERKVWLEIVNSRPPEWFGIEHIAMLESYCCHVCEARRLGKVIERVSMASLSDDNVLIRHERICKMRDREVRAASALATRMRLTQQSIYDNRAAGYTSKVDRAARPWQPRAAA